jgi:hypothetical protein
MLVAIALAVVERRDWPVAPFGGRQTAAKSDFSARSATNYLKLDPEAFVRPIPATRDSAQAAAIAPAQGANLERDAEPDRRIRPTHDHRRNTTTGITPRYAASANSIDKSIEANTNHRYTDRADRGETVNHPAMQSAATDQAIP